MDVLLGMEYIEKLIEEILYMEHQIVPVQPGIGPILETGKEANLITFLSGRAPIDEKN